MNGRSSNKAVHFTSSQHKAGNVFFEFNFHIKNTTLEDGTHANKLRLRDPDEHGEDIVQMNVDFRTNQLDEIDPDCTAGWFPIGFCHFSIAEAVDYYDIARSTNRTAYVGLQTSDTLGALNDIFLEIMFTCCKFPQDGYNEAVPMSFTFLSVQVPPKRLTKLVDLFKY